MTLMTSKTTRWLPSPTWRACTLGLLIGGSLTAAGLAIANPAMDKFETNYEKGQSANGEVVVNEARQPMWTDPAMVGGQPDAETMGTRDTERGQTGVNGAGQISSDGLTSFSDRIGGNPEFLELYRRVMDMGFTIGEDDYGHEGHIGNLEDRVTNLEDQPGNWQPDAPEPGPLQPIGPSVAADWTPAITTQEGDFTQTRTVTQDQQRTVNVYETNAVTGERRLVDTYTETETQTTTDTRLVDVANNPGGGTDGWSAWMNIGGVYNCTGYSPATSTRDQGVRFTQTRRCSQNQERFIYYLPEGDATTERRGTQVASVTQSRTATGTRPAGVWTYNRFPSSADRANLRSSTTPRPGNSCSPLGREEIYQDSGAQGGGGGVITYVVRCQRP